jgi:hypothetical protein
MENFELKDVLETLQFIMKEFEETTNSEIFKSNLMERFQIKDKIRSKIWKRGAYISNFCSSWQNDLNSKLCSTDSSTLKNNLKGVKEMIKLIISELEERNSTDFMKWILYYLVENISHFQHKHISFFINKLHKTVESGIMTFREVIFCHIDGLFTALLKNLKNLRLTLIKLSASNELVDLCSSIDEDLNAISEKFNINTALTNTEDIKECISGVEKSIGELSKLILELELFCSQHSNIGPQLRLLKASKRKFVKNLIQYKEFYYVKDFNLVKPINNDKFLKENEEENLDRESYELFYYKYVPYSHDDKLNSFGLRINALIRDIDFRIFFEHVCKTKLVEDFLIDAKKHYFNSINKGEKSYYVIKDNFEFFWDSIKVMPLSLNIASATTKMLTIHINNLPKHVELYDYDQTVKEKVIIIISVN